ncbi:MAG: hypothetical protein VW987_13205, partial [Alphaproteobacteria bacterium]
VTTTDDDAAGFTITESGGTSVHESGTIDNFTVVLDSKPTGDVVFSITSENTAEAQVTSSLSFDNNTWNTPKTVTVTGVDDDEDDDNSSIAITVSINTTATTDSNYTSLASKVVTATVVDNDTVGFTLSQSGGSTLISENGTRDDLSVVLTSQPNTTVRINFESSDTTEATVSNAFYTFDASNWNIPRAFRVIPVVDNVDDGNQSISITASINTAFTNDSKYDALDNQTVTGITVEDVDTAGYLVTESGGDSTVSEAGTTDTFTVVLNTEPTGNVVFDLQNPTPSEVALSAATLTFASDNWSTAQTVTLTGEDDLTSDGDVLTTITISINTTSTADSIYDALDNQTVLVTTTDNDSAGITITENGGGNVVGETGSTDTFTVRLNTKPSSGTVLIGLSSSDPEEITVSPDNLTFDNNTWSTAKTVTLTGVNDDVDDGDQNSLILVDVDNGSTTDSNYSNLPTINVGVTTTDNDTSGFTVIESGGTSVAESGTTDTFTVVLNSEPTGNVVLDVT